MTLTTDGPNKSLPLGEAFYLAGSATAPDVVRAHAVIVRVSWPFLGLGGPDTGACGRLQKERGVPANLGQVTGQVDAGALWPGTAEPEPTLVPEPWKRSGAEDQYKILVPSGPFFRPGASYCLYVFLQTKTTQRQDTAFKKVLLEFGTDNRACLNQHCSGTKIRCMEPALAAYEQCAQAAADKMTSRLDDVFQGIPSNDLQAAWDAIRARLINAVLGLTTRPRDIQTLVGTMAPRAYGPDGTLYPIGHPLGAAIAELTARTGELRRDRNVYVDAKGRKLEAIGIAAGFERLLVDLREPDDPTGKPGELRHEKLHIAADALVLPTTSVSLLEAWRFLEGKIRIGSEYVDIQGLWSSHLRAALAPPGLGMIPEASIDAISAVKSSFDRFNGLLSRARQTDDDDATHTASLLRAIKQHEIKLVDTEAVSAVASYMEDWLVAAQAWNAAPQIIREVTDEKWVNAGLVEAGPRGSLTQKRWFDTYFSPVVGRANVVAPSASFSEWYLGIQIFPWANSVDEPMWINGAEDLRRLLAVELAVIPTTGTYGPDKRFSGFDGPGTFPVMIGVALQPLPYVTASFGGIRQAEQQTRVVGEEPKEHWRPYFGLAVQGNVPGLVRALSTKSAAELKMEAPAK